MRACCSIGSSSGTFLGGQPTSRISTSLPEPTRDHPNLPEVASNRCSRRVGGGPIRIARSLRALYRVQSLEKKKTASIVIRAKREARCAVVVVVVVNSRRRVIATLPNLACQRANMASASVPLLMDDDTIAFGEEDEAVQRGDKLKHPYVTAFHLAFRISAIIVYLFCGIYLKSFIASFVVIILLLSMDFWTVKNITGRLMVGLRWWNYVDDNGISHWVFESRKGAQQNRINPTEARIFWLALILCPVMWCIFFLVALFGLNFGWLLLICIAIILNGANLYGYVKCKMGSSQNLSAATSDFLRKQVLQNVTSMMTRSPPASNSQQSANVI